jgi:hypothetical protein
MHLRFQSKASLNWSGGCDFPSDYFPLPWKNWNAGMPSTGFSMSDFDQGSNQNNAAIKSASHEWTVANTRVTNVDRAPTRSRMYGPKPAQLLIAPDSVSGRGLQGRGCGS